MFSVSMVPGGEIGCPCHLMTLAGWAGFGAGAGAGAGAGLAQLVAIRLIMVSNATTDSIIFVFIE